MKEKLNPKRRAKSVRMETNFPEIPVALLVRMKPSKRSSIRQVGASKSARKSPPLRGPRLGHVGSSFHDFLKETGDYEVVTSRAFKSVWDALERPHVAARLRMRAQLMHTLRSYIADNGLTQAGAAKRMGVAKTRIAALTNGDINALNVEVLLGMAQAAGFKVSLRIA